MWSDFVVAHDYPLIFLIKPSIARFFENFPSRADESGAWDCDSQKTSDAENGDEQTEND